MKLTATLTQIVKDWNTEEYIASFTFKSDEDAESLRKLLSKEIDIEIVKHSNRRTLQANKFFWKCVGELAKGLQSDPWSVYLFLLNRYGVYTYVDILEESLERFQTEWREVVPIGKSDGKLHCLAYYGSHTYTKEEFSRLINGTIDEMKEADVHIPATKHEVEKLMKWLRG